MTANEQYQHLLDKLNEIDKKVAVIETRTDEWCDTLFGNGQPGVLEKLAKRVGRLEYYLAMAFGGAAVFNISLGAVLWYLSYAK